MRGFVDKETIRPRRKRQSGQEAFFMGIVCRYVCAYGIQVLYEVYLQDYDLHHTIVFVMMALLREEEDWPEGGSAGRHQRHHQYQYHHRG
jgi:hypothetical protein